MEARKKIVLTGGHAATPALALVEEIQTKNLNWNLEWIGPTSAMEGREVSTAAEKTLIGYGVKINKITAGRLKRRGKIIDRLTAYLKLPVGFIQAFFLVIKIKPTIVVSFGGFASFPVVFAAFLLNIPIILHEQIVGAGLANKLAAPFATKIAVSREESFEFFPKGKTIKTGNPQISKIFRVKPKETIGNPVTIYITGGSSGSETINNSIEEILPTLLGKYKVIHQVGENNVPHFENVISKLPSKLKNNYEYFGYVSPDKVVSYFERADIIISRAGANTVSDIVTTSRPAILIPIPWSIGNEQMRNAQKAKETGLVVVVEQDNLNGEILLRKIDELITNWKTIVENKKASDFDLDRHASKRLLEIIENTIK